VTGVKSDETCTLTLVDKASGVSIGTQLPFGSARPSSGATSE
jgi:hypothetical protein